MMKRLSCQTEAKMMMLSRLNWGVGTLVIRNCVGIVTILLALLPYRAAAADVSPLLIYFLMDTTRNQQDKIVDAGTIKRVIEEATKSTPQTFVYFHLTNVRAPLDNFLVNYKDIEQKKLDWVDKMIQGYVTRGPDKWGNSYIARTLGQELITSASNFKEIAARIPPGSRRWLIAFHDFDLIDQAKAVDTSCCSLGNAWITSPVSPLRRDFLAKLDKDTSPLKDVKALAFLSKNPALRIRRGKESFVQNLLQQVGADVYYLGPMYPFKTSAPIAVNYVRSLNLNTLVPIVADSRDPSNLLQIFDENGKEKTVDVYR